MVLKKPFHYWFGFGGAISTLARQGGGSYRVFIEASILGLF
jgi:hypothetical protein